MPSLTHIRIASACLLACVMTFGLSACVDGTLSSENMDPGNPARLPDGGVRSPGQDAAPDEADSGTTPVGDAGTSQDMPVDVADMSPDMEPAPKHPNQVEQQVFFTCTDDSALASPARMRRINRLEWVRNAGRARVRGPANENPLRHDAEKHPYSTYIGDHTLEQEMIGAYLDVVAEAGHPIIGRTDEVPYRYVSPSWMRTQRKDLGIECFYDDPAPSASCVTDFVTILLERSVYHRTATPEEIAQMVEFATGELAAEAGEGSGRNETIVQIVSGAWLTTPALFKSEMGQGTPDAQGRRMLGDWEIAHAIGSALMSRRPGATTAQYASYRSPPFNGPAMGHMQDIYEAAESGTLTDRVVLADLLRAHLTGLKVDANGRATHVGGEDPERLDVQQEIRADVSRRGLYGLPEGIREFFVEYFDYAEVNARLKTDSSRTSSYWQISGIHDPLYGQIVSGRASLLTGRHGQADHKEQLDDMIARVVVQDQDVLKELLSTNTYFLPSNDGAARRLAAARDHLSDNTDNKRTCDGYASAEECAQNEFAWEQGYTNYINAPYEHDALIPLADRDAHWVDLPVTERAGVLTHPAWLSAHGANFENDASAIYRGKWIVEHLFCGSIPDVPITVDAQLNPESADMSARFRIAEKTETNDYCLGCHEVMNPLGYAFETYNHAGFLRIDNHEQTSDFGRSQLPMDTSLGKMFYPNTTINYIPEELRGATITDGVDLANRMSQSPHVRQCFVRHTFRYFMGRDERPEDACTLNAMDQSYLDNQGSFVEMLITLLTSDTFLYRVDVQAP
jgi:hypothetical protein